jgi:hypothetical protein
MQNVGTRSAVGGTIGLVGYESLLSFGPRYRY